MSKFYGQVGFYADDVEVRPGVVKPGIVERTYYGELLRDMNRWQRSEHQNDDFTINNKFSILSDPYAHEHWPAIKYIVYNGTKWKVNSVEVTYPRLVLEVGGVYNGT